MKALGIQIYLLVSFYAGNIEHQRKNFFSYIICLGNRVIKIQRINKTNLPLQFCMNSLAIIISQLGLVQLTNRKTRRKDINKLISRQLLIFINKMSANLFVYILYSYLPIGQLNKPLLTKHDYKAVHSKMSKQFGFNGPLCFYTSIVQVQYSCYILHLGKLYLWILSSMLCFKGL